MLLIKSFIFLSITVSGIEEEVGDGDELPILGISVGAEVTVASTGTSVGDGDALSTTGASVGDGVAVSSLSSSSSLTP